MTTYIAGKVAWGTVPDWIGAIGTILAFVGFAVAFLYEVRRRRLDDAEAVRLQRESNMAQARLVFATGRSSSETQVRAKVKNNSGAPIFSTQLNVVRRDGETWKPMEIDRRHPDVTELDAYSEGEVWLWLAATNQIEIGDDTELQVDFVDSRGFRWRRRGDEQPQPI